MLSAFTREKTVIITGPVIIILNPVHFPVHVRVRSFACRILDQIECTFWLLQYTPIACPVEKCTRWAFFAHPRLLPERTRQITTEHVRLSLSPSPSGQLCLHVLPFGNVLVRFGTYLCIARRISSNYRTKGPYIIGRGGVTVAVEGTCCCTIKNIPTNTEIYYLREQWRKTY